MILESTTKVLRLIYYVLLCLYAKIERTLTCFADPRPLELPLNFLYENVVVKLIKRGTRVRSTLDLSNYLTIRYVIYPPGRMTRITSPLR
jgi:hypothetical protein